MNIFGIAFGILIIGLMVHEVVDVCKSIAKSMTPKKEVMEEMFI